MKFQEGEHPKVFTCEMREDDPAKCTSAKMRKMGLARKITLSRIPREAIVLNPTGDIQLLRSDRDSVIKHGLVVIDCSWNLAKGMFSRRLSGRQRRLPLLLAGNPTSYSMLGRLSSVEAVAGALYVVGFKELAVRTVSIYKWGETFLSLNRDPLEEYSLAITYSEMRSIEASFFPNIAKEMHS